LPQRIYNNKNEKLFMLCSIFLTAESLCEEHIVKGMGNIMKQAQQMQKKMLEVQEELALRTVEATVGGGMVSVTVNGKNEVLQVKVEPQVVDPDDIEMLEDLIVAGVNEALRKAQEMASVEMGKLTGGLNIPGLF
jgi:DNA-binding YbaB/EbfC family protein